MSNKNELQNSIECFFDSYTIICPISFYEYVVHKIHSPPNSRNVFHYLLGEEFYVSYKNNPEWLESRKKDKRRRQEYRAKLDIFDEDFILAFIAWTGVKLFSKS